MTSGITLPKILTNVVGDKMTNITEDQKALLIRIQMDTDEGKKAYMDQARFFLKQHSYIDLMEDFEHSVSCGSISKEAESYFREELKKLN